MYFVKAISMWSKVRLTVYVVMLDRRWSLEVADETVLFFFGKAFLVQEYICRKIFA